MCRRKRGIMATSFDKYQPLPILTKQELVKVSLKQPNDVILVLFSLETTSLDLDADICQIAALPVSNPTNIWTCYTLPHESVLAKAAEINGLKVIVTGKDESHMTKNSMKVETLPYEEGIKLFCQYLCQLAEQTSKENSNTIILLVGHKAINFSARVLLNAFISVGIDVKTLENIIGFADSLSLLCELQRIGDPILTGEKGKSLALSNLHYALFGEYYPGYNEDCHSGNNEKGYPLKDEGSCSMHCFQGQREDYQPEQDEDCYIVFDKDCYIVHDEDCFIVDDINTPEYKPLIKDAVNDVKALYNILFESGLQMTKQHFLSHSCTVTSLTERIEFDKENVKRKRSFEGSLAPLSYRSKPKDKDRHVTKHITCEMVESGLVYQDLVEVYEKDGEEGLEGVLQTQQENGSNIPLSSGDVVVLFDLETTGLLKHNPDICQIAAWAMEKPEVWSRYLIPQKNVSDGASRINNLKVEKDKDGQDILTKHGKPVKAEQYETGMYQFYQHLCELRKQTDPNSRIILIAHNGKKFDAPVLINALEKINVTREHLMELNICFADSLLIIDKIEKENPFIFLDIEETDSPRKQPKVRKALSSLYKRFFGKDFSAHDAIEDVEAMRQVLFESPLGITKETICNNTFSAFEV